MATNEERGSSELAMTSVSYAATRLTYQSPGGFDETRRCFDPEVPFVDSLITKDLVHRGASWSEVDNVVSESVGPTGFVALSRIDQGSLFSLNGQSVYATLYLVGNPIIARRVAAFDPAATLYAPFRVVVYENSAGVHVGYDEPSSVFQSLGSSGINDIALDLDKKIKTSVEESCWR